MRFFLAFLGLLSLVSASSAQSDMRMVYFNKTTAVIDGAVPITDGGTTAWRWVHRIDLQNIFQAGDIVEVCADHEFTNDAGINVEIATAVTIINGWSYYDSDLVGPHNPPTYGDFIMPVTGADVDPVRHHEVRAGCGSYAIPTNSPFIPWATIIYRVRARSSDAANAASWLTVMGAGYGQMFVKVFRSPPPNH